MKPSVGSSAWRFEVYVGRLLPDRQLQDGAYQLDHWRLARLLSRSELELSLFLDLRL